MANTYTNLVYHFIFSTKSRETTIAAELAQQLYPYIATIIRNLHGVPIEIGGRPDHIHIIYRLKPDVSIPDMLRTIKANSAKWVNETGKTKIHFAWQTGYGVFSVSGSRLDSIVKYVLNQAEHHRTRNFQAEFKEFLSANKIAFDERHLWE